MKVSQLLTAQQTADLLQIDVGTLAVWRCKKQYQHLRYVKIGNRVRYRAEDVQQFIDSLPSKGNF